MALAAWLAGAAAAGESPIGRWYAVDDRDPSSSAVVDIHERGGVLVGTIVSIPEPTDGRPRICSRCAGADRDRPFVGLAIIRDMIPRGDHYGGTILDPEDGRTYRVDLWVESGALKVRGYFGPFFRTKTWPRAN